VDNILQISILFHFSPFRLENTLFRVKELKRSGGETTKPLLGQSLPGTSGYDAEEKLRVILNFIKNDY
jgi:hypothetical protein